MKKRLIYVICLSLTLALSGCNGRKTDTEKKSETEVSTTKKEEETHKDTSKTNVTSGDYYKPQEFGLMNLNKWDSKWCWERSSSSEHFYVFWEKGFGTNPNSSKLPSGMRVDIDDLLKKAEEFYKKNTEELGFEGNKEGYKFQIYLLYQTEWLATGSGYDNKIGALWVNPSTCQPVGSTIAHEIGHSFQYLIYCNELYEGKEDDYKSGFRYGYPGSNGGNGFWEQTAQWQALSCYPQEYFIDYHMENWFSNYHRAFENEWIRYQSYWFHTYIAEKHGITAISEIWKQSNYPEDALSCYMRIYLNNNLDKLYEELYDYAAHMATFDMDTIREYSGSWRNRYKTTLYDSEDGYRQVAYSSCPEATGFNVIPIELEEGKQQITADFAGLKAGSKLAADDKGEYKEEEKIAGNTDVYNVSEYEPGWRYGFVALCDDDTRIYGEMNKAEKGKITFDIPSNAKELYFVVLGAPNEYCSHGWDEKEITDMQTPYKVKFLFS